MTISQQPQTESSAGKVGACVHELERLMAKLATVEATFLAKVVSRRSLSRRLTELFLQTPGQSKRRVEPYHFITPDVQLGFQNGAVASVEVQPSAVGEMAEVLASTVRIEFDGPGDWVTLETPLSRSDLGEGRTYQIGVLSRQAQAVRCRSVIRAYQDGKWSPDHTFAVFDLPPGEARISLFGPLALPKWVLGGDCGELRLLLFLSDGKPVTVDLDFLSVSFG